MSSPIQQTLPACTHPSQPSRRVTSHEGVVRDVASNDGPGTDGGKAPDIEAGDDHGPRPDRRAGPKPDRAHHPVVVTREVAARSDGAWEAIVGKDRVRTDEDAVVHRNAVIDERGVLDLHPVADDHSDVDERIAANDALRADPSATA